MDFEKAVNLINDSSNVLITSHRRPDGDACGSVFAIAQAIKGLGKNVQTLFLSEMPKWYEFIFDSPQPILDKDITVEQLIKKDFDLVIIVDTNSLNQLTGLGDFLEQYQEDTLVIDHHVTGNNLGSVEIIDTTASAAGVIVFDLLVNAGWEITEKIAQALFVSISTDTGWFAFPNTDSRTLKVCAELIDREVPPAKIHHDIYQNFTESRFKLMTAMLNTLQLHFNGRYASQFLTLEDFKNTGANYCDTENFIDECRKIKTVEAACFFVELEGGKVKCSLRSSADIDVRRIAQRFGGGGHTKASGAHLAGPLEDAMKLIYDEIALQLAS